jgi:hypothetical protein
MSDAPTKYAPKPPTQSLDDIAEMTDHLAGSVAASTYAEYARARTSRAIELRDLHIRAARQAGARQIDLARETGLSVAMIRVICR